MKKFIGYLVPVLFPLSAMAQCPDGIGITANKFCINLTWTMPPQPLPQSLTYNSTVYQFSSGTGQNNDPAKYSSGGGNGACNSNLESFSGSITINGTNCFFTNSILPLSLLSFTAQRGPDNAVLLSWSTTDEKNMQLIEVQKSGPALSWSTLSKVAPKGAGTGINNYAYEDKEAGSGLLFYRLKLVDQDNNYKLSEVVQVDAGTQQVAGYSISSQGLVQLSLPPDVTPYSISVYNLQGICYNMPVNAKGNRVDIDLSTLSSGIYLVRMIAPGAQTVIKVLR